MNDQTFCIIPSGSAGKGPACQCRRCRRHRFDPWAGKIPWRRKWQPKQPTPVFFPGKSMDKGAWKATVHGVAKSWILLSGHACTRARACAHTHTHTPFWPQCQLEVYRVRFRFLNLVIMIWLQPTYGSSLPSPKHHPTPCAVLRFSVMSNSLQIHGQ